MSIEQIFVILPNWVQSKLVIRIIYTSGSFLASRIVAFLTGNYLNSIAAKFVSASGHLGIVLQFKVVSVDQRTLETAITAALMIIAEFAINRLHENMVKPAIFANQSAQTAK